MITKSFSLSHVVALASFAALFWSSAGNCSVESDFKSMDDFGRLGVTAGATEKELKSAYRNRIRQLHPDADSAASPEEKQDRENALKLVIEAYDRIEHGEARTDSQDAAPKGNTGAQFTSEQPNTSSLQYGSSRAYYERVGRTASTRPSLLRPLPPNRQNLSDEDQYHVVMKYYTDMAMYAFSRLSSPIEMQTRLLEISNHLMKNTKSLQYRPSKLGLFQNILLTLRRFEEDEQNYESQRNMRASGDLADFGFAIDFYHRPVKRSPFSQPAMKHIALATASTLATQLPFAAEIWGSYETNHINEKNADSWGKTSQFMSVKKTPSDILSYFGDKGRYMYGYTFIDQEAFLDLAKKATGSGFLSAQFEALKNRVSGKQRPNQCEILFR